MPYIPPEVMARAREMGLLTYLRTYETRELVHFGGGTYCTREHDSLKIPTANGADFPVRLAATRHWIISARKY